MHDCVTWLSPTSITRCDFSPPLAHVEDKVDIFAMLEITSLKKAAGVVIRLVRNDGMESGGRTQCQAAPLLVFSCFPTSIFKFGRQPAGACLHPIVTGNSLVVENISLLLFSAHPESPDSLHQPTDHRSPEQHFAHIPFLKLATALRLRAWRKWTKHRPHRGLQGPRSSCAP